jgi:hypothetical protein
MCWIIVVCKAEVVSPSGRELEGKWASPYRNSRQSYCHGRVGAGIADGAASNLISGIREGTQTAGEARPLLVLGSRACTGHVIPGPPRRNCQLPVQPVPAVSD